MYPEIFAFENNKFASDTFVLDQLQKDQIELFSLEAQKQDVNILQILLFGEFQRRL